MKSDGEKKAFRNYKGVKIHEVIEESPNLKELKDGRVIELKPIKETVGYTWHDGYPYNSVEEAERAVDRLLAKARQFGVDESLMVDAFNGELEDD